MAHEPDTMTGDALSNRDGSTDDYTPDTQRHPADLERDIERTRAEMSETIDAIGARFQPAYLREQAREAVRETARDAGTSMIDTIRDNPLPAAIAGLSIAWLLANRTPASGTRHSGHSYGGGYDAGMGYGPGRGYDRYGARDHGGSAGSDHGASLGERAGDALGAVREQAASVGSQVTDSLQSVQEQAGDVGRRATGWLEDQMDRNPLSVGAVALAAGALVGWSLPTTDAENEWLGQHSDQLAEKVTAVASEKLDQAKEVAASVAQEAKAKASEVVEVAKEKASDVMDTAASNADGRPAAAGSGSDSAESARVTLAGPSDLSGRTPEYQHVANANRPDDRPSS